MFLKQNLRLKYRYTIAIRFLLLCLTEIAGARHRLVAGIVIVATHLIITEEQEEQS